MKITEHPFRSRTVSTSTSDASMTSMASVFGANGASLPAIKHRERQMTKSLGQPHIWCWTKGDCKASLIAYIEFYMPSFIQTIKYAITHNFHLRPNSAGASLKLGAENSISQKHSDFEQNNNGFEAQTIDLWGKAFYSTILTNNTD